MPGGKPGRAIRGFAKRIGEGVRQPKKILSEALISNHVFDVRPNDLDQEEITMDPSYHFLPSFHFSQLPLRAMVHIVTIYILKVGTRKKIPGGNPRMEKPMIQ